MHLTLINFFKKTVPGHIFRGKRRLVREVTFKGMRRLIAEYKMQEENMVYLKNPYITLEQSQGHALELEKQKEKLEFWRNNKIRPPFKPHVRIQDRLIHLRVKEKWD